MDYLKLVGFNIIMLIVGGLFFLVFQGMAPSIIVLLLVAAFINDLQKRKFMRKHGVYKKHSRIPGTRYKGVSQWETLYIYKKSPITVKGFFGNYHMVYVFTGKDVEVEEKIKPVYRNVPKYSDEYIDRSEYYYSKASDPKSPVHYGPCKYGSMIKNRVYYKTIDEAKASGRNMCKVCNPERS